LPESDSGIRGLMHEAEFYGITPLTQQLKLVQELEQSSCGNSFSVLTDIPLPEPLKVKDEEASNTTNKPRAPANKPQRTNSISRNVPISSISR